MVRELRGAVILEGLPAGSLRRLTGVQYTSDEDSLSVTVLEDNGCVVVSVGGVCSRGTFRARLDLEVVEGRGVDGFNSRNWRSSLTLMLARSPRRLVRKFVGVASILLSVR